jgi:asparagine synthase (glutamine-hydrolysing)
VSAISGIFHRDGKDVPPETVGAMLDAMAHRAPDGGAVRSAGAICFGHGALHSTPASVGESLPLAASDGLVITGDLRLDNRDDLAALLGIESVKARPMGDGELVLRSYQRWGRETPSRLEGAFAFAIWDPRRLELLCARDHFGAKPFVYFLSRGLFVFSSEVEGVLAVEGVPRRINEVAVADFLARELEGVDRTSTIYRDISKLPAATTLTVGRDGESGHRYWQPDASVRLNLGSDEEYVEAFREGLGDAVGNCLRSTTPIAVMMSGGIDSTSIAAVAVRRARRSGGPAVRTHSVARDESDANFESRCIRRMAKHLDCESTIVNISQVGALDSEIRRAGLHSSNFFDCLMTVADLLYRAQKDACRVVLDGVDGDLVLSLGSAHVAQLIGRGRRLQAFGEVWAHSRRRASASFPWSGLAGATRRVMVPDRIRAVWRRFRPRRPGSRPSMSSIVNPDLAQRVGFEERIAYLDSLPWFEATGDARRDQANTLTHPYVEAALERYDRVGARHGVEPRHPLLTLRFVELCLSLPWHLKMRDGWTKYILRRSSEGMVPDDVCWRSDKNDVLWAYSTANLEAEREFVCEAIRRHKEILEGYVDFPRLERSIETTEIGANTAEEEHIWSAASLALWLEREIGYDYC